MLQPKRTKFRKTHKGRNRGLAYAGGEVSFGDYGLKAITRGQITAREIEAARRAFTRAIQRRGQVYIRVFPDKPITEKALGVRMGKGKGNVEYWVCPIQPGKVLFELGGIPEDLARKAFSLASAKLSVQTTFVSKAVL
ncbi:MAG: 50S ribosomal protein L16 [Succinivibrionaceae bacterium]|jgi:large subunit ribosomal protein L16|nr:50S ribosomal protein L16 [Succinivibrionaceae bacterium]MEE1339678.1 50S ribosomal protein L16 [Succinivibrionaceae bacterium]